YSPRVWSCTKPVFVSCSFVYTNTLLRPAHAFRLLLHPTTCIQLLYCLLLLLLQLLLLLGLMAKAIAPGPPGSRRLVLPSPLALPSLRPPSLFSRLFIGSPFSRKPIILLSFIYFLQVLRHE